jgi:hypothetical protein
MNISKRFMTVGTRVFLYAPFLFLLSAVLIVPPLYAFSADKGSSAAAKSFKDLPPGAAMAMAEAIRKELPEEYQLAAEGKGYSLSNPAHGMGIAFTPDGLQVMSGGKSWGMTMTGIGTRSSVKPVQEAVLKNDDGRLVYARGNVAEWYVNSPWGVEQGFTIENAPGERSRDGLVIELSITGELLPSLDADTLFLTDAKGNTIVRYTGLNVFDADSKSLPARLTLADSTLRIHVDDVQAKYPVTIDPWIQKAKLTASDGAQNDKFGYSVAISGNTVVVGADGAEPSGAVYVFTRPGTGWADMTETAKLTPSDGGYAYAFGHSVAVSGDTVVAGAYVFVKPVSGWDDMTETAKLTPSVWNFLFGASVAISGDTIVVGAPSYEDEVSGSAYVFVKPVSGWADMTETAKLTPSVWEDYDDPFGYCVAISGDTIVVGASGAVYVFARPGTGWTDMTETAKLTPSGASGSFGDPVAISGDTIVIGTPDYNYAYVFTRPGTGWADMTETAKLTASDGSQYDDFGQSVSISGNTIVVGAPGDDDKGSLSGSAYVFARPESGSAFTQTAKLTASDGAEYDQFGHAVAISGDTIVIGGFRVDDWRGSTYVFYFDYPVIKSEQWSLILDNGLGSANMTLSLKQDGTITADGNWKYLYQGSTNVGTFTGAPVTISGTSITLTATGTATNPSAPPGYTTSPYTSVFSGTALDGEGSGTYRVFFQTYGWPDKLSGSWQGKRTSGSGITAVTPVKPKALPWLMLLLED